MGQEVIQVNVVVDSQIVGERKTEKLWLKADCVQRVNAATSSSETLKNTAYVIFLGGRDHFSEILIAETAESFANRWINGTTEAPPPTEGGKVLVM